MGAAPKKPERVYYRKDAGGVGSDLGWGEAAASYISIIASSTLASRRL